MGIYENYVQNQEDLLTHFSTGENAQANREATLAAQGYTDPSLLTMEQQLDIVGKAHYDAYGEEEIKLGARKVSPTTPSDPAPFTAEQLKQIKDNTPISVSSGGGDYRTMNITQGPDVDYNRIQGFVGTPEVRDAEGNITTEATGIYAQQQMPTGLMSGQQDLMTGQQTLGTGQTLLAEGQTTLGEGQTQLAAGQQGIMGGQQALGEGQQAIGGAIGVADQNQPQTLFGGQMALGQGQAGITTGVQGLGRDLTNLTGNLSDFENAQRQYQLTAEGQRAQGREIGMTTRDQLEDQLRTVGAQTNQMAEQQALARQQGMMARQQAPQAQQVNQASQAAQIAGQNLRSFAPQGGGMMGPTGPVAVDPRDQVGFGPTRSPV